MDRTLTAWTNKLLGYPKTIECPMMKLIGRDFESTIFEGPGRIEILSQTEMSFFLYGQTKDNASAMKKIQRAEDHLYDALEQFRLIATDYHGVEWNCGYTTVDFFAPLTEGWPLTGEIHSLTALATGDQVNATSSVELLLSPLLRLPLGRSLTTTTSIEGELLSTSASPYQQIVEVLGTTITFSVDPSKDSLWIGSVYKTYARFVIAAARQAREEGCGASMMR